MVVGLDGRRRDLLAAAGLCHGNRHGWQAVLLSISLLAQSGIGRTLQGPPITQWRISLVFKTGWRF
jgi:hypothetical protein